jgi:hypothetical protein
MAKSPHEPADHLPYSQRASEADEYRRKARDAERSAETAETAEAKEYYLEIAKNYYGLAESAERGGR